MLDDGHTISNNSISTIHARNESGEWVFDDKAKGLQREPFVAGADTMIEELSNGSDNVTIRFSRTQFPGQGVELSKQRHEFEGAWYTDSNGRECWLCGATKLYFGGEHPDKIYVQVLPKDS